MTILRPRMFFLEYRRSMCILWSILEVIYIAAKDTQLTDILLPPPPPLSSVMASQQGRIQSETKVSL
jgi:hypothetical protein